MLTLQAPSMDAWDRTVFLWLNLDAHSPDVVVALAVWTSRWLPGVALADLRDAARSLQAGGVGFYPREAFVHLDTGRVRHW